MDAGSIFVQLDGAVRESTVDMEVRNFHNVNTRGEGRTESLE